MPRVTHFEIHAGEPAKLAAFYRELFGWKMQHLPHIDYWLIDTSEGTEPGINGGLLQRRGPKPADGQPVNAFVCTVSVTSVDTFAAKALKLGGTEAVPKMAIPGVGWVAYCKDPDGNIFGLHQEDANAK
ncbi:MAG: VOC family protein [Alphaproteobacteria bacterium]|nr:VOC family protein [Alphaproteobacteria bacterium]